jgi:hypothetical protein
VIPWSIYSAVHVISEETAFLLVGNTIYADSLVWVYWDSPFGDESLMFGTSRITVWAAQNTIMILRWLVAWYAGLIDLLSL